MSLVHKWCFLFIHNICRTKNPISCEDGYKQTKIYLYSIFSFPASKMNQMEVIVWLLYHQLQQPWSTTLRTRMGQVWASSCSPSSTASRRQLWLWLSTSAPTCLPRIQPTTQGRYWNSTNILKMIFIQLSISENISESIISKYQNLPFMFQHLLLLLLGIKISFKTLSISWKRKAISSEIFTFQNIWEISSTYVPQR